MWRVVNSLRQTMALIQLTSKLNPVKDSWFVSLVFCVLELRCLFVTMMNFEVLS